MPVIENVTSDQLVVIGNALKPFHGDYITRGNGVIEFLGSAAQPTQEACLDALLEGWKARATGIVDSICEMERQKYLTGGDTMSVVYVLKMLESLAYISNKGLGVANPPEDYPMLGASIGPEVEDLEAAANLINTKRIALSAVGANIENKRLNVKKAIKEATTIQQIDSLVANLRFDV